MSDLREAAKAVIQAWDDPVGTTGVCRALDELRAVLAEPEQEPLTDEEIRELSQQHKFDSRMEKFVRIVERAHGIGVSDEQ